jgi:hypothetical protein
MRRNKRNVKKKIIINIVFTLAVIIALCVGAAIGINGARYISGFFDSKSTSAFVAEASSDVNETSQPMQTTPLPSPTTTPILNAGNKNKLIINVAKDNLPSYFKNFFSEVFVQMKHVDNYKRKYNIEFPNSGEYSALEGVTCFRGNNYRDSASYGTVDIKEKKLEKVWFIKNGKIDEWSGTGWNGQPAIVKWSNDVKNIMNINPAKKKKADLKEVIYATLDGNIYFLDLDDGKPTRNPIRTGVPHKGSVAVDPRGYPLLYAGQGIPEVAGKKVPIGYRIFNLINQKQLYFINGMDPDAFRYWGAFDSGALIDAATDSFIECGENGIIYSGKLNTSFKLESKSISIRPDLVKYRYRSPISKKIGVENSPVIYKNYIYFADNSGLFQCVDLNTLKTVWVRDVVDDTDSSTVLEETDNGVFLYTANEVDHHGNQGASYIKKLDALSGKLVWEKRMECHYDSHTNGGALATPVLGRNDIGNLVIYNIAKTNINNNNGSTLIALNRNDGTVKWKVNMKYYCWSSPVAVYSKDGKSYIIMCDSAGNMTLFEGATGKTLDVIPLEANIEASPAVYDNMIVVGTRGCKIWGIKIK